MAHKKSGGSVAKNRDSISKRLGVKRFGSETVKAGNILIRQKGNKFYPGVGTKQGNNYTIFATVPGNVEFKKRLNKTLVNVV